MRSSGPHSALGSARLSVLPPATPERAQRSAPLRVPAGNGRGPNNSAYAQMSLQQQYDVMYGDHRARNQVPGFGPPPGAPAYGGAGYGPPRDKSAAAGLRPTGGYNQPPPGYRPY